MEGGEEAPTWLAMPTPKPSRMRLLWVTGRQRGWGQGARGSVARLGGNVGHRGGTATQGLEQGQQAHPTTSIHRCCAPALRPAPARNHRAAMIIVI